MPYPYDDPELEELAALFDEEGDPSFMDRLGGAFAANPIPMPQANPHTSPFAGFLMGLGSGASNAIGSGYQRKQAQKEKSASTRLALARFGLEKRKGEMAENERRAKEKAAADAEAKRAEAERVKAAEMDPNTPEGQARIEREAGYEAALDKRRTQLGLPSKFKPERAKPPAGMMVDEEGNIVPKPVSAKGVEKQTLAFYMRAQDAINNAEGVDQSGKSLEERVSQSGYAKQLQLNRAPNAMLTPEQRRYRQAQRAFTEARLRKESGAAIAQTEYDNDSRIYFAQPGDDAATLKQKREARQIVLDGLANASGPAYDEWFGEPYPRRGAGRRLAAPAPAPADSSGWQRGPGGVRLR